MLARRSWPASPLGLLGSEMDRVFADVWNRYGSGPEASAFPSVNVWEDATNVYVEAEVPGLKLSDLEISAVSGELTIKGARHAPEGEQAAYHRRERGAGEFVRVLRLPVAVNASKAGAMLSDGVLTVTLPKTEEAKPRKIEVKVPA